MSTKTKKTSPKPSDVSSKVKKVSTAKSGGKSSGQIIQIKQKTIHDELKEGKWNPNSPVILTVKNASDQVRKISLFKSSKLEDILSVNHPHVHAYVHQFSDIKQNENAVPEKLYSEITACLEENPANVGLIYIQSATLMSDFVTWQFELRYKKSGKLARKITFTMDPYQQQTTILAVKPSNVVLGGDKYLDIVLKANTRVTFNFYLNDPRLPERV